MRLYYAYEVLLVRGRYKMFTNKNHSKFERQSTGARLLINRRDCVITIKIGTNMDLRLYDLFMKAIRHAQGSIRNRIVVDLEKTDRIFDSGLSLLLLLNTRSWRRSCKVLIINCNPDLEQRIEQGLAPGMFNLSQGNQNLGYGFNIEHDRRSISDTPRWHT